MSGLGHIGELQVIDHLEKVEKCAIYLPMKDKGIDFIAVKNNKSTQIQVKTSKFLKNSYYWFDLSVKKMVYSDNTVYILVLYTLPRRKMLGKAKNYLIVPSLKLKEWINGGMLALKKSDKDIINFYVYPDEESLQWKYKNKGKELDVTEYWNNFTPINLGS
jgi:predicted AlkP superfamily phosphohydrolase/phosphomutase